MENEIRYFSIFTGAAGIELGLEGDNILYKEGQEHKSSSQERDGNNKAEGGEPRYVCVGMSENDKFCSRLLASNFPHVKNWGDATKINPHEIPDFDLLCGGFPCQAFSIAGRRRGFKDTRGILFFEIARILEVKKPKLVLLENVKGLLHHEKGETFSIIIQTLFKLGYDVQWMVLNSKFFGVPQNRERVFIIANLRETSRPEILPFRKNYSEIIFKHDFLV
jgi:DNA (cytosine-5)-methyltransferase 1